MDKSFLIGKNLAKIIQAVDLMASPDGATIERMTEVLGIKRRSVFRLLKTIKQDLRIPVSITSESLDKTAVYRLPEPYLSRLRDKTLSPITLTFSEALLVYSLLGHDIAHLCQEDPPPVIETPDNNHNK
jgi:hypothetical protein